MKNNFKPGFTLIELMAVIVILGILASVVAINVNPFLQRANYEKIQADITQLEKALEVYKMNQLTYPSTENGLIALVKPPENIKRPFLYPIDGYIKSIPLEPWVREYLYLYPGTKSNYDLFTYGSDGIEGGSGENADIGNWQN